MIRTILKAIGTTIGGLLVLSFLMAQALPDPGGGGGGTFTGGTLSSPLLLDNANTTCATALALAWEGDTNAGFQRSAADAIKVCLAGLDLLTFTAGQVAIHDSAGTVRGQLLTRSGATEVYLQEDGTGGVFKAEATAAHAGSGSNVGPGSAAFIVADSINTSTGGVNALFRFFGEGVFQPVPGSALAISGTPDTTRDPVSAGTSCRFSAASPGQTWTWPESNSVTGMMVCCTNTGSNSVVVNDSAGVFEGTGATVGQWDTICAEYVTDRWVQRSFSDN